MQTNQIEDNVQQLLKAHWNNVAPVSPEQIANSLGYNLSFYNENDVDAVIDSQKKTILVNRSRSLTNIRWSVAYALGLTLYYQQQDFFKEIKNKDFGVAALDKKELEKIEDFCNYVALAILVPKSIVLDHASRTHMINPKTFAKKLSVSEVAVKCRLQQLLL